MNIHTQKFGQIEYSDIKLKENEDDEKGYATLGECYNELRKRAAAEFSQNNIDKPLINVKVDFVDLAKTTEYQDYKFLSDVKLGDTVTVVLNKIRVEIRVIKTVYDTLSETFTKLELRRI